MTIRRDFVTKTDLIAGELRERPQTLEDGGYVDQISDGDHELVMLTLRGEYLVGGYR